MGGGSDKIKIIAEKGTQGPIYNRAGDPRLHVTGAVSVNAAGGVLLRIVHDGERCLCGPGRKYLNDLPSDGVLGVIEFSVTDSGYVKRHIFLLILKDIVAYCVANNIPFPIVLFVDGYGGHFHIEISEFCRENQIVLLGKFIVKPKSKIKVLSTRRKAFLTVYCIHIQGHDKRMI